MEVAHDRSLRAVKHPLVIMGVQAAEPLVPLLIIGCCAAVVIANLWQKWQIVSPDEGVKTGLSESVTGLVNLSDCKKKIRKMSYVYPFIRCLWAPNWDTRYQC